MAGTRNRFVRGVAAACLALLLAAPAALGEGGPLRARIPDVRRLRLGDAQRRLEGAGFRLGKVYELSRERILAAFQVRYPVGYVFMQAPSFVDAQGRPVSAPIGTPVHVVVAAVRDGPELPPNLPGVTPAAGPRAPAPPKDDPKGSGDVPAKDRPDGKEPARPTPADPPAPEPPDPDAPGANVAQGSPDAPRAAPKADPQRVPTLTGLELTEAEQLVREAQMTLYVERVGGHPIGRVLEQIPPPGSKRPAGGVIKVIITAGGDFEGARPGAPEVYVPEVVVPGVLDRTVLQARRILGDLGLKVQEEQGKRGPAGRVVDQMPAAGGRVAKGGVVRIWIAPGEAAPAPDAPPPPGPLRPDGAVPETGPEAPPAQPEVPAPKPPLAPGPLPGGVPQPVSPGVNTQLPKGESVPVGFTWRGVQGADAYLLEIEEQGAEGRWIPLARKPARKTAVLMEIERLDPAQAKPLRWRVRAVIGGKPGTPSNWVQVQ